MLDTLQTDPHSQPVAYVFPRVILVRGLRRKQKKTNKTISMGRHGDGNLYSVRLGKQRHADLCEVSDKVKPCLGKQTKERGVE